MTLKARSTCLLASFSLCLLMLAAPGAQADDHLDEAVKQTCSTDPGGETGFFCLVAQDVRSGAYCAAIIVDDLGDVVIDTLAWFIDNLYPIIGDIKCAAVEGIDDNIDWWNEDVYAWYQTMFCWAWGGEHCSDPHGSVPFWAQDTASCLAPWGDGLECEPEDLPDHTFLLPPPPPYPTGGG